MVDDGFCDGTFYISRLRSVTKSSIVSVLVHANRFPIDWFAIFPSSLADTPFVGAQYRRLIAKKGNSPTRFIVGDYQQKHGSREAIKEVCVTVLRSVPLAGNLDFEV